MDKQIGVLIVDDSKVARELLAHIIGSDPALKVIGTAENGEEALSWLTTHEVDVITMDIYMPYLDGFEATRKIMQTKPVPIVIVSGGYSAEDKDLAFRSLEVGALAILEKPSLQINSVTDLKATELVSTIKMIAGVKLIKRRPQREKALASAGDIQPREVRAIAIGASLGGPLAIATILSELSDSYPVPIFVVQHIAAGFTEGFVQWLRQHTKLQICLARDGDKAQSGHVYVAPDKCHMKISKEDVIKLDTAPTDGLQPSVSHLFRSMGEVYGPYGVGVLLTGMGSDGAEDLLFMKQRGAYTIAQDRESCIVYGMPGAAVAIGAASKILPLSSIAEELNTLIRILKKGSEKQ